MGDRDTERERYRQKLIGRQKRTPPPHTSKSPKHNSRIRRTLKTAAKILAACLPVITAAAIAAAFIWGGGIGDIPSGEAYFYFFDVGQADAAAIITNDSCILIDAGSNLAAARLTEKLRRAGVEKIDLAVFSHSHEDHIGGSDSVLKEFKVTEILMPHTDEYSPALDRLLKAADARGTSIAYTQNIKTITVGALTVEVLPTLPNADDENEESAIVKITFGNTSAIYTGDAGTESERYILSCLGADALNCDILKVGHHGSDTSNCEEWISAISPDFAVISCEMGNEYGHPSYNVLRRLQNAGAEICRTDKDGSVLLVSNGTDIAKKQTARAFRRQD